MSICQDLSTKFLRDYGYNPIRLPSENVKPYDILFLKPGARNKTSLVGSLKDFTASPNENEFPIISKDIAAANMEGVKSSTFNLNFGLTILANLLSALGGAGGNLSASYQNAQKIQFTYKDVSLDLIRRAPLANFLNDTAKPKLDSPFIQFFDEEGEALIIAEIAKSNQFEVEAFNDNGVGIEVDISGIQGAIGSSIGVETSSNSTTKLVYKGETKISFAFKAVPFWLDISIPVFKISPFGSPAIIAESRSESDFLPSGDVLLGDDQRRLISIKKASINDLIN